MKPLRYTRHARNRMRWYRITEPAVERCVGSPEWVEQSVAGRVNAWREANDKFLRVTYREEVAAIVIIPAVLKRRPPGR